MDIYTIWADKEGDISDLDWVTNMKQFFDHLAALINCFAFQYHLDFVVILARCRASTASSEFEQSSV